MGLFDKLRGNDDSEEVELKPPREPAFDHTQRSTRKRKDRRSQSQNDPLNTPQDEEVELEDMWDQSRKNQRETNTGRQSKTRRRRESQEEEDSGSGDFILPGMKSVSTGDEEEPAEEGAAFDGPDGEKLNRLLEQNERIISLLEDIAEKNADSENGFSESSMW